MSVSCHRTIRAPDPLENVKKIKNRVIRVDAPIKAKDVANKEYVDITVDSVTKLLTQRLKQDVVKDIKGRINIAELIKTTGETPESIADIVHKCVDNNVEKLIIDYLSDMIKYFDQTFATKKYVDDTVDGLNDPTENSEISARITRISNELSKLGKGVATQEHVYATLEDFATKKFVQNKLKEIKSQVPAVEDTISPSQLMATLKQYPNFSQLGASVSEMENKINTKIDGSVTKRYIANKIEESLKDLNIENYITEKELTNIIDKFRQEILTSEEIVSKKTFMNKIREINKLFDDSEKHGSDKSSDSVFIKELADNRKLSDGICKRLDQLEEVIQQIKCEESPSKTIVEFKNVVTKPSIPVIPTKPLLKKIVSDRICPKIIQPVEPPSSSITMDELLDKIMERIMPTIMSSIDNQGQKLHSEFSELIRDIVQQSFFTTENIKRIREECQLEELSTDIVKSVQEALLEENKMASKDYVDIVISSQNSYTTGFVKQLFEKFNSETDKKLELFIKTFENIFDETSERIKIEIQSKINEKLQTIKHETEMRIIDLTREVLTFENNITSKHQIHQEYVDSRINYVKPTSGEMTSYHSLQFNGYNNNVHTIHVGQPNVIFTYPKGSGSDIYKTNKDVDYDDNTGKYIINTAGIYVVDANFVYISNDDVSGSSVKIYINGESILESVVPSGVNLSPGVLCNGPVVLSILRELSTGIIIEFIHTNATRTLTATICSGSFKIYRVG